MSPVDAHDIVEAIEETVPDDAPGRVAYECECGWESAWGRRKVVLQALERHLVKCH